VEFDGIEAHPTPVAAPIHCVAQRWLAWQFAGLEPLLELVQPLWSACSRKWTESCVCSFANSPTRFFFRASP